MFNIIYTHNKFTPFETIKRFLFLVVFTICVFSIYNNYHFENIFSYPKILNMILTLFIFFLLDLIAIYYLTPEQIISINPNEKTMCLTHKYIFSKNKTEVVIKFDKFKDISVIKIKNNKFDIKVSLANEHNFNLFAHGDYIKYNFNNVLEEYMKIENTIFPEKQFFLDNHHTNQL